MAIYILLLILTKDILSIKNSTNYQLNGASFDVYGRKYMFINILYFISRTLRYTHIIIMYNHYSFITICNVIYNNVSILVQKLWIYVLRIVSLLCSPYTYLIQ